MSKHLEHLESVLADDLFKAGLECGGDWREIAAFLIDIGWTNG